MADRLSGEQRREFFARHEVPEDKHLIRWYGLSLDDMTKAELRVVIDNCCVNAEKEYERRLIQRYASPVF